MSPSKRAISIPLAALAAAIVGANAWTAGVVAHPIAVARGVAVIGGSRVRITLQEAGESLIHEMPAAHASSDWSASEIQRAFARRAGNMVRRLEVRDETGRLLIGRLTQARLEPALADAADPTSSRSEERVQRDQRVAAFSPPAADRGLAYAWGGVRALYELEYVAERPLEHVTFRQAPPEDAIIPTQLALRIREQSSEAERFVRLTSAGNAETLDLWPRSQAASQGAADNVARPMAGDCLASMMRHRFQSVQAVVRREPDRVLVEAYLPLALLETWRPIDRKQADFVTPVEQRSACEAAVRLLRENISLTGTSPEAEAIHPAVLSSIVLGPDQAYLNDGATRPGDRALGAWSARVAVRLEFVVPPPTESTFKLDWRLFNPAVLTADLLIINGPIASDGSEAREHQVTTYNPTIVLNMPVARSRP